MILLGLVAFTFTVGPGPWWPILLAAMVKGAGFGICWAFVIKRLREAAAADERDLASAALPTLQQLGFAFGAAAAGIIANLLGAADANDVTSMRAAAPWIFAVFLPFAVLALLAARRLAAAQLSASR